MNNLSRVLKKYIDSNQYQGIEWIIKYKGKIYSDRIGYLDKEKKIKIKDDTVYRIWSMTKPIISIVILQLIEENKIKFEDPINYFLPIFDNLKVLNYNYDSIEDVKNVEKMPTIKDLLLHTAGFSYNFLDDIVAKKYHDLELFYSDHTTLKEEINLLSSIPLLYEPGTKWTYSVSVDVLARIIEIVCNNSLEEVLKERIFTPLKMFNTSFSINNSNNLMLSYHYDSVSKKLCSPNVNPRYISNYGYPLNNKKFSRGGIGLYSTAKDYMAFALMLQTGKTLNNNKIISTEMLKKATMNQISSSFLPYQIKNFDIDNLDENIFDPYGWGYGFRVLIKDQKYGSIGEFGWSGAASTYFLVDPYNSLTAVLMTQVFQGEPLLQQDFYKFIYSHLNS